MKLFPLPPMQGEMERRLRGSEGAPSPPGLPETWPQPLAACLDLVLQMRQPAALCWGAEARLFYNDAYAPLLGRQHPAALGRPLAEVWPDFAEQLRPRIDAVLAGEAQLFQESRYDLDTGGAAPEPTWFTATWTPVRGEGGRVLGFVNIADDVTGRVEAERKLRQAEERQAFLLRLSDAIRPIADPVEVQLVAARLLGRHLGAARVAYAEDGGDGETVRLARNYTDGVPGIEGVYRYSDYGDDLLREMKAGRAVVRPDIARDPTLSLAEKQAHAVLQLGATLNVPLVKSGRLVAILAVHYVAAHDFEPDEIDLAEAVAERTWAAVERARAEARLRESEERFRQFAEASSDVLWVRTADTLDVEYASASFRTVFGTDRDSVVGEARRWAACLVPDDREDALRRLDEARSRPVTHEYRIMRASDGAFRWIRDHAFPLLDAQGRVQRIGGIATDVTEAKQLVGHQALLLAELQHRVRNIMAKVRAVTAMTGQTAASVADYLDLLSGRLMAMARTQALLTQAVNAGVDIRSIATEEIGAQAQHRSQFQVRGPAVVLSPKAAEVMSLALHELATNALKYGALSVPTGRVCVTWDVEHRGETAWLTLDWTEEGAPPRAERAADPGRRGFGTQLIEQRVPYELRGRGTLSITSGGARCRLEFPLKDGASILETDAPMPATISGGALDMEGEPDLAGHRVLVLEDDFYLALDTSRVLRSAGAEVIGPFPDENDALAALEQQRPTAAVLDINLGYGPSYRVADYLSELGVPLVFLTGYDHEVIPAHLAGAPRLQKPVELRHIVRALSKMPHG